MTATYWRTFHFGAPWLLLLVPVTLGLLWWLGRGNRAPALLISSGALMREIGRPVRARLGAWSEWLVWLAAVLLVLAVARPQIERGVGPETARAIDVVLLVDASRSMETKDFDTGEGKISRLEALREVVGEFVKSRPHDRIGVLAFAEKPYLVCPLTLDHSWMIESLANVETALGTAIGSSIEAGVDLLRAGGNESRVMVLITDGLNTSGSNPLKSAELAAKAGVTLYTIAAVSYDNIKTSNFEQNPMHVMAKTTGGRFFQAGNRQALQAIYSEIDRLERHQLRQLRQRQFQPLYGLFVGAAGLLLLTQGALGATRWLRVP